MRLDCEQREYQAEKDREGDRFAGRNRAWRVPDAVVEARGVVHGEQHQRQTQEHSPKRADTQSGAHGHTQGTESDPDGVRTSEDARVDGCVQPAVVTPEDELVDEVRCRLKYHDG